MRTRMIGAAVVAAMSFNLAAVAAPAEAEQKVRFTSLWPSLLGQMLSQFSLPPRR